MIVVVFTLNWFTMSYGYVPLQELIITYPVYGKQMYTWGLVRWGRLAEEIQNCEKKLLILFFSLMEGRHWMSLMLHQSVVW